MSERHSAEANITVGLLRLAATPTFAIMAVVTSVVGRGAPDGFCSVTRDASPLSGMALMYLLMGVFHSGPWVSTVSAWRRQRPVTAAAPKAV